MLLETAIGQAIAEGLAPDEALQDPARRAEIVRFVRWVFWSMCWPQIRTQRWEGHWGPFRPSVNMAKSRGFWQRVFGKPEDVGVVA